ncbi:MAG: 1-acyl-sn-glycerol-3-phosphate acyltransferase [Clostridia bacterium]|nr:1-acyl-sn-glycerol-3-phosphate acyltransferase [Clostridia bacterium]
MDNNFDVNYKNPKKYKTAKYPIRQPIYLTWLIQVLSKIMLIGKEHKVEKFNMEGLKPPYLLLSNHMSFVDFEMVSLGTYPHRVNNVVNIDGFYMRAWLLEWIGAICTRKFTTDLHLIKSIRKVLERGDVLCMYPEARYSPVGTTSYLPESLGMLVKRAKVPVVIALHHGNYLHSPFWNFRKKRKVPLYTTFTKLWDPEDLEKLSVEQINAGLKEALTYDDYKYQKDNGILITEPYRAEGLNKILYKCPNCRTEHKMSSAGAELFCEECGKRWYLNEDGTLSATEGETEFSHIPDWFEWERSEVRREVESGEYSFEDDVEVYSLPRCYKYEPLGFAKLTHNPEEGFILTGHYRGKDYRIQRTPLQTNSLHVEYDFLRIKPFDLVDISTENDSFYCYTSKKDVITKLAFATEEIYRINLEKKRNLKKDK